MDKGLHNEALLNWRGLVLGRSDEERSNLAADLALWNNLSQPHRYHLHVRPDYVEHFPGMAGGLDNLVAGMTAMFAGKPAVQLPSPLMRLADGDMTLMLLPWGIVRDPQDDSRLVQLLHFELRRWEGGKMAEHWDGHAHDDVAAPARSSRSPGDEANARRMRAAYAEHVGNDFGNVIHVLSKDGRVALVAGHGDGRPGLALYLAACTGNDMRCFAADHMPAPGGAMETGAFA